MLAQTGARYPTKVGAIVDQVQAAVLAVGVGKPVTVRVEDLVLPTGESTVTHITPEARDR